MLGVGDENHAESLELVFCERDSRPRKQAFCPVFSSFAIGFAFVGASEKNFIFNK
jgi:hypothetical protein